MGLDALREKIQSRTAVVAFVGLGKMGLPSALLMADAGYRVVGIDVSQPVIDSVHAKKSPYLEPGLEELIRTESGRFEATSDYAALSEADVVLCAVPTGIDPQNHVDYTIVRKAFSLIGKHLKKGSLVVFESNVTPGTTETLVKNALEDGQHLKHGTDYWLAYVPIQGKAGKMLADLKKYPRVVSGLSPESRDLAALFFKQLGNEVDLASSVRVCELQKLFANIYKDVNLALANELSEYCEKQGIDVREVIRYVNYWPGIHLFEPDVGVGGNCLPVDPYFYLDHAQALHVPVRLPKIAREINDNRPRKIAQRILDFAKKRQAKTLVLYGAAFRTDTHETAYSPALKVFEFVKASFPDVKIYDPLVGEDRLNKLGLPVATEMQAKTADVRILLVEHRLFKESGATPWRSVL